MHAAAAWMVDAPALAETLDQLRAALSRPISVMNRAFGHDREQLAASLRVIFGALDKIDLSAARAMSGFVREFRPHGEAQRLQELFRDLEDALQERVNRILGPQRLLVAARLLASPSPDLLRILGREHDENSHSDLIAWLLTPRRAPTIAPSALRRLTSLFEDANRWHVKIEAAIASDLISVRREVHLGRELAGADDLCRIDVFVCGPGFVLAIENKVWSSEHSDQTTTYWGWLEPMEGLRGGLFVSPGGLTAGCPSFRSVSYMELLAALLEGPATSPMDPTEEIVLGSYLKTLARYILPVEMRAIPPAARALEER